MDPFTIALIAGAGIQLYSSLSAAGAQRDAMERDAFLKGMQADELLARELINEQIMREQAEDVKKTYVSRAGSMGGGGLGLGGVVKMKYNLERTIANSRRDAEFKARMLRAGADIQTQLASDVYTAGLIGAGGTILTSAGKAHDRFSPKKDPESLFDSGPQGSGYWGVSGATPRGGGGWGL